MLYRVIILLLLVGIAYIPACQGDFIWDDDFYVSENAALPRAHGLWDIWFTPNATPQYYPLVFTSYWLEYRLWQLHPAGYHWVNVVLHGLNAALLWLLLRRLQIPFAWLAAAIFALHPVHVESVAWITERKNVLSGFFYLIAFLAWLRFAPPLPEREGEGEWGRREEGEKGSGGEGKKGRRGVGEKGSGGENAHAADAPLSPSPLLPFSPSSSPSPGHWGWYAVSLGAFVAALLSKTVTCSLPAVLVLVIWWKRGWPTRREIAGLLPMFAVGLALALNTSRIERDFVIGPNNEDWTFSFAERCLIASRALWFYVGKLLWPHPLIFNYERWHIDVHQAWQYLFPLGCLAVLAVLAWPLTPWPLPKALAPWRTLGKGPLTACLIFAGTLFPALGFVNVYPMIYYFAADHFQYLASIAMICLAMAVIHKAGRRWPWIHAPEGKFLAGALLLILGWLTWMQGHVYRNLDTLWTDTRTKNPEAWMAHYNFGHKQASDGNYNLAIQCCERTIQLNPRYANAYNNWGFALWMQAQEMGAAAREAVRIGSHALAEEKFAEANKLYKLALEKAKKALEYDRTNEPTIPFHLGNVYEVLGDHERAIVYLEMALDALAKLRTPNPALTARYEYSLADALLKAGRRAEALTHAQRAVELRPDVEEYQQLVDEARRMKPGGPLRGQRR